MKGNFREMLRIFVYSDLGRLILSVLVSRPAKMVSGPPSSVGRFGTYCGGVIGLWRLYSSVVVSQEAIDS